MIFEEPGQWKDADRLIVEAAVNKVGEALSRYVGLEPLVSFNLTFGEIRFLRYGASGFWAYTQGDTIRFRWNTFRQKGIERLIAHELGHIFDLLLIPTGRNPAQLLWNEPLCNSWGLPVTGRQPPYVYNRHWGRSAERGNGYRSNLWPDQWHPRWLDAAGNTPQEDWADIFQNWVYGMFASNEAGTSLYNWLECNMPAWMSMI